MSKRQLGGVTVRRPSLSVKAKPSRVNTCAHCAALIGMPMTLAARSARKVTGAGCGRLTCWSSMGPASPPQMSMISRVMCSMCSTVDPGSTPRSKRCPASVLKLNRRDRPAIASGHQNAASTYTCFVSSDTAVASPPMMPASDSTAWASAITPTFPSSSTVLPFSSFSVSPGFAQRTSRWPWILSRSKMCDGRPYSNIT